MKKAVKARKQVDIAPKKRRLNKKAIAAIRKAQKARWKKFHAEKKAVQKAEVKSNTKKGQNVGNERSKEFWIGYGVSSFKTLCDLISSASGGKVTPDELRRGMAEFLSSEEMW